MQEHAFRDHFFFFLPILDDIKSLKQEHRLRIRVCACAAVVFLFFMACACGNRAECVKKKKASGASEIE